MPPDLHLVPPVGPEPPEHLTGEALVEWQRIAPELRDVGLLGNLDRAVVAAYCVAYARWSECERQVRDHGMLLRTRNGVPIPSPFLAAADRALEQVRQLSEQIGLTASGRMRLTGHKVGADRIVRMLGL